MSIKVRFGIVVMFSVFLAASTTSFLNYSIFKREMVKTFIVRKENTIITLVFWAEKCR